ncbi:MAG: exonuclease subunit SbcD, partial [Candidatus Tectomicrobia bacterium]|nr:exonuclease subunit SbcD [Candidatus Tectomicrobia bacterium]
SWQRAFAGCVRRLAEAGVPVVILVGNHDQPNTLGKAHAVEIFDTLGLPRVTVISRPELRRIETAAGPVQVAGFPYMTRSFMLSREQYKELSIPEANRLMVQQADEILRDFAEQLDPSLPAVLTLHGSVANATLSSEQSIMMVGHDPVIPLSSLANPAWDYVALGHIHRHQDLNRGQQPPVVYAGSIERIDFGEEKEDKGFVWAQVEKSRTAFTFVPVPARRFVTLRLDARDGDPLELLGNELAGTDIEDAIVRVIVTVAAEDDTPLDERRLRDRLRAAYLVAGIVRDEVRGAARTRDSGLTETLGPLQAVERYLQSRPEYADRREALLERTQALLQEMRQELLA